MREISIKLVLRVCTVTVISATNQNDTSPQKNSDPYDSLLFFFFFPLLKIPPKYEPLGLWRRESSIMKRRPISTQLAAPAPSPCPSCLVWWGICQESSKGELNNPTNVLIHAYLSRSLDIIYNGNRSSDSKWEKRPLPMFNP